MSDFRISIVHKADLDQGQLDLLDQTTAAARSEPGPSGTWDDPVCFDKLRAIVLKTTNIPIGLFHIGGPPWATDVGWWICCEYRGQKYCSEALKLLTQMLIAEGVTGLAKIAIRDTEYERSLHLLEEFAKCFNEANSGEIDKDQTQQVCIQAPEERTQDFEGEVIWRVCKGDLDQEQSSQASAIFRGIDRSDE